MAVQRLTAKSVVLLTGLIQSWINGFYSANYRAPVWPKNFDPEFLAPLAIIDRVVVHLVVKHYYEDEEEPPPVPEEEVDKRPHYIIQRRDGTFLYEAIEKSNWFLKKFCVSRRPFRLQIFDENKKEVIRIYRKFRCDWICFPGFLQTMKVQVPPGTTIGRIHQVWNWFKPKYRIADVTEDTLYYIHGPVVTSFCCAKPEFKVKSKDGKIEYGKVTMDVDLCDRDKFDVMDFSDTFLVLFAANMDLRLKALQIGLGFMMRSAYYEYALYDEELEERGYAQRL